MRSELPGLSLCLLCVLGAAGCDETATATRTWQASDHGQPADAPQDGRAAPPPPSEGGQARAARALYQVSCAGCHGATGRGDGSQLPPGARPPSFADRDFMAGRSDADLAKVIADGRGLMPSFADKLSAAGIEALVAHIRGFGAATAAPTTGTDAAPAAAAPDAGRSE